jgi:nitrite reductase (NADH) small subunit
MSEWVKITNAEKIPTGGGGCALIDGKQYAIFTDEKRENWYAVDNECPHKKQNVLSRGITGCENGEPKVACPLHKNTFSLRTGEHMGGDKALDLKTYPIKVEANVIYLKLAVKHA